jgi:hypothetical protein
MTRWWNEVVERGGGTRWWNEVEGEGEGGEVAHRTYLPVAEDELGTGQSRGLGAQFAGQLKALGDGERGQDAELAPEAGAVRCDDAALPLPEHRVQFT